MLNFNNNLTSKIISLAIAVSFFMADISYAGASSQGGLRVPMGAERTYKRLDEGIKRQKEWELQEIMRRFASQPLAVSTVGATAPAIDELVVRLEQAPPDSIAVLEKLWYN